MRFVALYTAREEIPEEYETWTARDTMTTYTDETPFNLIRFIVLETTVSIFTIITAYITAMLVLYECKQAKVNVWRTSRMSRSARYSIALRILSILAVLFTLGRFVCEHYELLAQYMGINFDYCNTVIKVKVGLSAAGISFVYTFLWTRQRYCYAEPAMSHLSTNLTRLLSWLSIIFLFLSQVIGTSLFLATRFYKMTYRGCFNYSNSISAEIPWIWLTATTISSQIILFALFVYPIVQHKSLMPSSRSGFSNFLHLIRRTAIISLTCILSDGVSSLLILLVKDGNEILPTLCFDLSLLINVICIVASFSEWKARLSLLLCCRNYFRNIQNCSIFGKKESKTQKSANDDKPLSDSFIFITTQPHSVSDVHTTNQISKNSSLPGNYYPYQHDDSVMGNRERTASSSRV